MSYGPFVYRCKYNKPSVLPNPTFNPIFALIENVLLCIILVDSAHYHV
jgi:hypothetical protein